MSNQLTITPLDSLELICFKVSTALKEAGIASVLTGGSAATVYAPEAYRSDDADFVVGFWTTLPEVESVLESIGLRPAGRVYAVDGQPVVVDIVDNQVLIGSESVQATNTIEMGDLSLTLLTPTDCVRDRLCSFFWYADFSALKAAIAVAVRHQVDLAAIRRWAEFEGELEKFQQFERQLAGHT